MGINSEKIWLSLGKEKKMDDEIYHAVLLLFIPLAITFLVLGYAIANGHCFFVGVLLMVASIWGLYSWIKKMDREINQK